MRLKKHLTKIEGRIEREKTVIIPQIFERIKKDCDPFLKKIKKSGKFIYRGNNKNIPYIRSLTPREDRAPKDMPEHLHKRFDEEFYKKFGWKPRSQGIFTTFKRSVAEGYGSAHLFFPIGNYKYIWSTDISDLYSRIEGSLFFYNDEDDILDNWSVSQEYDEIYGENGDGSWWYKGEDTEQSDEDDAKRVALDMELEYGHKLIDEYKLKWVPDKSIDDFVKEKIAEQMEENEKEIEYIVKSYTDKNLVKASRTNHEIMFKCKKYYLVNGDYEGELHRKFFP